MGVKNEHFTSTVKARYNDNTGLENLSRFVKGDAVIEYKVVELSVVTDESVEKVLNDWTLQRWHFDSVQFVVRDASKRPSMAFVLFTRDKDDVA